MSIEEPKSDLVQEFERLSQARQATVPESEETMGLECSELRWSSNPGAYEAQLIRRCGNPYFPESQRIVSEKDLVEAKRIDNNDYVLLKERLTELEQELKALPSTMPVSELFKIRKRLEDLIEFSMGVGGQAYEVASEADQFREVLISTIRAAFSNDEESLAILQKADTFHKQNVRKFNIPVMAQMRRERSPIRKEDTIATILSEDPQTIALVMRVVPEYSGVSIRIRVRGFKDDERSIE